jgi:nucleoside-diphosphate-sugar epimerase
VNALEVTPEPVHDAPRPGDVGDSEAARSAVKRDLGYEPTVSLENGLRVTIASGTGA